MVARDEGSRFLSEVLDHLRPLVDVIVFTDDASTDNTLAVAKSFDCETYESTWDESQFSINEGQLRQEAWKNLEKHAEWGDWILAIDADEKLFAPVPIREYVQRQTSVDVLGITFFHMWNRSQYRVDRAWRPSLSSRLFRYYPNGQFNLRKLACGSEPTYVQDSIRMGRVNWNTNFRMQHLGYVKDDDKEAKYDRYMVLDGGDFHSRAHIQSIMDPNPVLEYWRQ